MVSFRTDRDSERALDYLAARGIARSEAIRRALIELADRERDEAIRAEVAEVAADPEDRAEKMRILAEMDALAPPADDP